MGGREGGRGEKNRQEVGGRGKRKEGRGGEREGGGGMGNSGMSASQWYLHPSSPPQRSNVCCYLELVLCTYVGRGAMATVEVFGTSTCLGSTEYPCSGRVLAEWAQWESAQKRAAKKIVLPPHFISISPPSLSLFRRQPTSER